MASMWQRVTVYLGLGPDDGYAEPDGFDDNSGPVARPTSVGERTGEVTGSVVRTLPGPGSSQVTRRPAVLSEEPRLTSVAQTSTPAPQRPQLASAPAPSVVRPIRQPATPVTLEPNSFNDAQEVADRILDRTPVIVNLQGAEQALSRRLIDFASGLCYGIGGQMTKVANHVYLLTPPDMQVPTGDQIDGARNI